MAWIDPRYLEHQAKRFIRPNWERYMRPDWRDRKYWVGEPPDNPFGLPNARRPIGKAAPLLDHWAEQEAIERERLALQRRLNALRLELATFKHDLLLRRKAYNPQQPRVPAGNPTGGRWTDDASSSGSFDFSAARRLGSRPHGHHFIPHGLYAKNAAIGGGAKSI